MLLGIYVTLVSVACEELDAKLRGDCGREEEGKRYPPVLEPASWGPGPFVLPDGRSRRRDDREAGESSIAGVYPPTRFVLPSKLTAPLSISDLLILLSNPGDVGSE